MPPSPIGPAIPDTLLFSSFIFFIKPLKMDLTEGSETSAQLILTPGKYPKESIQDFKKYFDPWDFFS
jgi:hypothetical protein